MLETARIMADLGFSIVATSGTQSWLSENGVDCGTVKKVYEGRPNVTDNLKNGEIALLMNTTEGQQAIDDSRDIRAIALNDKIPYFTTAAASNAAARAIKAREEGEIEVRALQG
jgi:carbamoyl-phosphate synthase large subunit